MAAERKLLWTVTDPRGLMISLAEEVWQSHLPYRPELASHFDQVRLAAQNPDAIYFDPDSTADKTPNTKVYWYYKSEPLSGKFAGHWIAVVVKVVVESADARHGLCGNSDASTPCFEKAGIRMEKMRITDYHYYPESDELDLVINVEKPREAISVPLEDEFFFLRVDPETKEIVGATIMNASHYLGQLAHAFAMKAFDDPNVRFFLERRVESFAKEAA